MSRAAGYLQATRHPWPSLLFLLPVLAAYEVGVVWMGGDHPETLRNGADHWMRCQLMAANRSARLAAAYSVAVRLPDLDLSPLGRPASPTSSASSAA